MAPSDGEPGLVSIVVICHDSWPFLEIAVWSALQQSYGRLEVIVVDNGSTDATPGELARIFGDRIRYVRQANNGGGGAYNRGIREARGEFVHLLDGDDFLAPHAVEKQMEIMRWRPD